MGGYRCHRYRKGGRKKKRILSGSPQIECHAGGTPCRRCCFLRWCSCRRFAGLPAGRAGCVAGACRPAFGCRLFAASRRRSLVGRPFRLAFGCPLCVASLAPFLHVAGAARVGFAALAALASSLRVVPGLSLLRPLLRSLGRCVASSLACR